MYSSDSSGFINLSLRVQEVKEGEQEVKEGEQEVNEGEQVVNEEYKR